MFRLLALLVGVATMLDPVGAIYVRIQALEANDGERAGGERVLRMGAGLVEMDAYDRDDELQVWEKTDEDKTNRFYLHLKGDITKRLTMYDKLLDGVYHVGYERVKQASWPRSPVLTQFYTYQNEKIYCNSGEKTAAGRRYTLQFSAQEEIYCGLDNDQDEEKWAFVSDKEPDFDGNQFFLVNHHYPEAKVTTSGSYADVSEADYGPNQLFKFKKASKDKYYIIHLLSNKRLYLMGSYAKSSVGLKASGTAYASEDRWILQRVQDNLGNEWDYYFIKNERYTNWRLNVHQDRHLGAYGNRYNFKDQWFRIIPRYRADDEGYQLIARHRGHPEDTEESVTFTKGLTLTKGWEISTSIAITQTLEYAIKCSAMSGKGSTEIEAELSTVNTSGEEKTWSQEVTITRTFPGGQDCALYQRKVEYASPIVHDELVQTPRDFKMVCQ